MPTPSPPSVYQAPEDLRVGDCFDPIVDTDTSELLGGRLGSPDAPHLADAFGVVTLDEVQGVPWSESRIEPEALELCDSAFEEYVGIAIERSQLAGYYYYGPLPEAWDAGGRRVLCVVEAHSAQPFTDSIEGSRR